MTITIYSEGAAQEVTGSRHIISVNDERVMIDCGAFQGRREEADRKNRAFTTEDLEMIDALVLTHAHFDHCGLVPLLVKKGFSKNIYSTPASRDLASLIMMDSASIQARDREYLKKQAAKRHEDFTWEPLYNEDDVILATGQFVTVSYNRPIILSRNISLEFFDAGHILGSAMASLAVTDSATGKKLNVAFSGDLGRKGNPILRDPARLPAMDYLILESTYGERLHDSQDSALVKLAKVVNDTVKRGGRIVIPAFAIERTQELVYYLHVLTNKNIIPPIPIYVDSPMATSATGIFQLHPECYDEEIRRTFTSHHKNPFGFDSLHFTNSVEDSKNLNEIKEPIIVISADGMCEAGRIQHHLIHAIEDRRNTILLVGYMAENTLGRKIQEGQSEVRIMRDMFKVRARVEEINAFSAHADYGEMWQYLSSIDRSKLKKIYLVHGESKAQNHLQEFLLAKGIPDVEIVKYGEKYELK
jgi:metallo-beta-lactamase family protein